MTLTGGPETMMGVSRTLRLPNIIIPTLQNHNHSPDNVPISSAMCSTSSVPPTSHPEKRVKQADREMKTGRAGEWEAHTISRRWEGGSRCEVSSL